MRIVNMSDERERQAFAEKAARRFKNYPNLCTFGEVEPDAWFAVRWGLGDDCVLVFRIGDDIPMIYGQLIRDVSDTVETA